MDGLLRIDRGGVASQEVGRAPRRLQKAQETLQRDANIYKKVTTFIEPSTPHIFAQAKQRATASFARMQALSRDSPGGEMARIEASQFIESQLRTIENSFGLLSQARGGGLFHQVHSWARTAS